ncbi:hypothetical protein FB451DRAFT_1171076 [Mycena latifolia]|nr:hypothetical protein FB451DRAFT_1171076 [Mycena latifolia]
MAAWRNGIASDYDYRPEWHRRPHRLGPVCGSTGQIDVDYVIGNQGDPSQLASSVTPASFPDSSGAQLSPWSPMAGSRSKAAEAPVPAPQPPPAASGTRKLLRGSNPANMPQGKTAPTASAPATSDTARAGEGEEDDVNGNKKRASDRSSSPKSKRSRKDEEEKEKEKKPTVKKPRQTKPKTTTATAPPLPTHVSIAADALHSQFLADIALARAEREAHLVSSQIQAYSVMASLGSCVIDLVDLVTFEMQGRLESAGILAPGQEVHNFVIPPVPSSRPNPPPFRSLWLSGGTVRGPLDEGKVGTDDPAPGGDMLEGEPAVPSDEDEE